MSFSEFRRTKIFAQPDTGGAGDAHPLDGLAQRLSGAGASGPETSPRRDLEQLVSMLAKRKIPTDGRLNNALEGLARWTDRPQSATAEAPQGAAIKGEPKMLPAPSCAAAKPTVRPKPRAGDIKDMEQRLGELARSLIDPDEAPESAPVEPRPIVAGPKMASTDLDADRPAPARAALHPVASLRAALAQIAARQKDLDDSAPAASPQRGPIGEESSRPVDAGVVVGLRQEIDALGRAIADLPTRSDVDGLLRETAAIAMRDAAARPARLDSETLRAIEALVSEVERMRGDAASPQMIARFGDELAGMSAKLDAKGPSSAPALAALAERIEDIRGELARFPRVDAVAELAGDVQSLVARLEKQERAAEARVSDADRIEAALRAELASFSSSSGISDVGRKLEVLAERLETRNVADDSHGLPGKIDTLNGKIDALAAATLTRTADVERVADVVRSELAALAQPAGVADIGRKLEALTAELARRPQAPDDFPALAGKIDDLGGRMADVAAEAAARTASFDRIEEAVRGIAEHLVVTSQDQMLAPGALNGVENRIALLVDDLGRSGGRIDDLNAGFAALAARIEQSNAGIGAEAGRSAAAAVRESFIEQGSAGGIGASDLAEALSEIRAAAARNDRRTVDTLDAVRMTLERLVDRIEAGGLAVERPALFVDRETFDDRPMTAPAPVIDPTEAARAAARRAMAEEEAEDASEPVRLDRPVPAPFGDAAPDHPLEPGSAPRLRPMGDAEPAQAQNVASLIASARRATIQPSNDDDRSAAPHQRSESRLGSTLAAVKARRRPLLLALAAALIVFGIVRFASGLNDQPVEMAQEPAPQSGMSSAPAPEAPAAAVPQDGPSQNVAPGDAAPEETAPPSAPKAEDAPAAPPAAPEAAPPAAAPAAPKPGAMLTPPRAPAADMTDFAFAQSLQAPAKTFTPPATGDDLVTGSIARGPDALPDAIGGSMLRLRAVQGDPSAQIEIADRLAEGRGVPADPAAAVRWLEKAAAQGLAPAQHRLGSLYEKGRGVARDVVAARRWYEQAAAAGNVRAMHNLGVIHAEGGLGKPDFNAAIVWFRMAAERGLVDSQFNLAVLEARGLGGKRDLANAYKWFALANAQGDQDAGKKRDEVGKALGARLVAAKQAVADFRPRPVEGSANETPAPAGGWDQASLREEPTSPAASQ